MTSNDKDCFCERGERKNAAYQWFFFSGTNGEPKAHSFFRRKASRCVKVLKFLSHGTNYTIFNLAMTLENDIRLRTQHQKKYVFTV